MKLSLDRIFKEGTLMKIDATKPDRVTLFLTNYTVKIALTDKGVEDNVKESNLSEKLQPFSIKFVEGNGYMNIYEPVNVSRDI